ncbi:MAG: MFS transporter [Crocinitomicaceae bacterium]
MINTYSKNFWMLCISMFLFMTSFNLILPELNQFITNLGGGDKKGLIFVFFAITALISRPYSGKLSDTIGRKRVMYLGVAVSAIICLLYPLSHTVLFFLFLRFVHGIGAGFTPTGATALITDILPISHRGRGMGIWGTFISLGIGVGQSLGSLITNSIGLDNLFLIASLFSVVSAVLLGFVRETLPKETKQKFHFGLLKLGWKDIVEPAVWPCAFVMFLSAVSSGIIFTITPDISNYLHISNKGWFFLFYTISTILVRLFSGSLSDKIGRRKTLVIGMALLIVSVMMIAFAKTWEMYTAAAVMFGFATGISSPTIFSWTADLSHPERRGIGSGTMFIALEAGFIVGSLSTLFTYNSTWATVPLAFGFGAFLAFIALIYLLWHLKYSTSAT